MEAQNLSVYFMVNLLKLNNLYYCSQVCIIVSFFFFFKFHVIFHLVSQVVVVHLVTSARWGLLCRHPFFYDCDWSDALEELHPFVKREKKYTLQGTNISPKNGILKMIFRFPRWDMLIPWRVSTFRVLYPKPGFSCFLFNQLGLVAWCRPVG